MRIFIPAFFVLPLLLSACATQPGDFARKESSVFNDTVFDLDGGFATGSIASSYSLTDQENELRNVAWDLVRPPYNSNLHAFYWAQVRPAAWYENDENDFYRLLRNENFASHESYYEALVNQARGDASRLPVFRDVTMRVGKADGARRAGLNALAADARMRDEAEARISENRNIVKWVEESLHYRIRSYRTALGRFMVEVPSTRAVEAEAAIDALEWEVGGARLSAFPIRKMRNFHSGSLVPVVAKD